MTQAQGKANRNATLCQVYNRALSVVNLEVRIPNELQVYLSDLRILRESLGGTVRDRTRLMLARNEYHGNNYLYE
jgi:hypothetical protein